MTDYLNFALDVAKANWDFLAVLGLAAFTAAGLGIAELVRDLRGGKR